MGSLRFWAFFWISCLIVCHFQNGSALFLSHKKKSVLNYLVKSKLAKLHAALSHDDDYDDDYDIAHYHHYHYDHVPLIVVPHHGLYKSGHGLYKSGHGFYKSGHGLGHYDPWHIHSYHPHHGWPDHHDF